MLSRRRGYLEHRDDDDAPAASIELQREGWTLLRGVLGPEEVAELRAELDALYASSPPDVRRDVADPTMWEQFRYEGLNRSALVQRVVGNRAILDAVEPLLGEDCHVIANTIWRNPPDRTHTHGGGKWHIDAGPHVPRGEGIAWDERIPYPVFAVAAQVLLQDCPASCGPTGVIPGSHTSGRTPPRDRLDDADLRWNGRKPLVLEAAAGDVQLFVSDVWHRRMPTAAGDTGRYFVQVHYGRRELAQRLRPTAVVNHLSPEAVDRAVTPRERTLVGLHPPFFYDG